MIRDLMGQGQIEAHADVLVIGAGTIGLVLATELAARGKKVICLESGGREQESDTHPLNATEQTGTPYAGADHGRFRCLGGTSTRWGGALIPFQASDMSNAGWPITWEELAPYVPKVEALFGLPPGPYEEPDILPNADFIARLAKWPAFGKRNVYSLLKEKADAADGPEIWINATATGFVVKDGRLCSVKAESTDGAAITVCSDETVIAAGAIESTRILLLIGRQNPGSLNGKGLGEGFHDHLSAVIADLEVSNRSALNKVVGFQFSSGGGMRNMRFEIASSSEIRDNVPPCFVHIGFSETQGGFLALRDVYRALQRRKTPNVRAIVSLLASLPWLARAAVWRYVHRRLLFPDNAHIQVHLVIEQSPVDENCITLSEREVDQFGQPIARIDWKVFPRDLEGMERAIDAFENTWKSSQIVSLARLRRRSRYEISSDITKGGGIYHPGGTTKIARSSELGVIDSDLRAFGVPNISLCATSILPTGGGANPTMTTLLMALRYAERICKTW